MLCDYVMITDNTAYFTVCTASLSMFGFLLGDVVYVMWKPRSEIEKSEWK